MVARILVLILSCIPVSVWALGLGQIELHSALNQPLDAEIKLSGVNLEESESIKIGLGSAADFAQVNLARPYWLSNLRFKLINKGDASYIKVTTHGAVTEPYVSFLMVMEAPDGRLSKQYAVLLDPPVKPKSATIRASSAANDYANVAPAPRQVRRQLAEVNASSDNQYGPVRQGDTLSGIVRQLLPTNGSVSSRQMMMGLLDANPDAFIGNNINRLKTGYTLIVPDQFLDRERLSQAMSGGAQERLVVEAPSAEEAPSAARTAPASRSATGQAPDPAATKKLDELNEVAASRALEIKALKAQVEQLEKRAGLLDAKLALRDEQIAKLTSQPVPPPTSTAIEKPAVEKPEAHAKVAETAKAAPAKTEEAVVEPAAKTEKTPEVITEPTAKTEEVITEPTAKTEEVITEPTAKTEEVITEPTAKTEEVITEPTAKTEEVITEPTAKTEEVITEPTAKTEEVVEPAPAAATETPTETPVASTEEAAPEAATATETEAPAETIASIEEVKPNTGMNWMAIAAVGVAVLFGLGATFWVLKRRNSGALAEDAERDSYIPDSTKPSRTSSTGSMFSDDTAQEVDTLTGLEDLDAANETAAAKPTVAPETVKRPNFEDTAILSVEDTAIFDGDDTAILDELMPSDEFSGSDSLIPSNDGRDGILAEVDIALAYGNHDQAEELLQGAIADSPQHHEYSVKLLEVYHAAGNADAFAEKAAALHLALAGKGGTLWKKVEQMGRDLCPHNPLFASAAGMEPTRLADDDEALLDMGLDEDNDATALDMSAASSSAKALDFGDADEDDFDLSELGLDDSDFTADAPDNPFMSNFDATTNDHSTITMAAPTGGDDGLSAVDFGGLGDDSELLDLSDDLGLDLELQGGEDSESIDLDFGDEFDDALANSGVVLDEGLGDHTQVFEFNESDEVGTKLDLARAYIDMGDSEGARGILDEVIHEGNEQQKHEAEVLMRSIT